MESSPSAGDLCRPPPSPPPWAQPTSSSANFLQLGGGGGAAAAARWGRAGRAAGRAGPSSGLGAPASGPTCELSPCVGQGWAGLGWAGLGWAGLGPHQGRGHGTSSRVAPDVRGRAQSGDWRQCHLVTSVHPSPGTTAAQSRITSDQASMP